MLTVSHDPDVVESQLVSGELFCPRCGGVLSSWGSGEWRSIRSGVPAVDQGFIPRRAKCRQCGVTHVLLPVVFVARRADDAAVIAEAVELKTAEGLGHRKIAEKLGRPASTVRDWLRDFRAIAPAIVNDMAARVHRATAEALEVWPAPAATVAADALGMLMAHAKMLAQQYRPEPSKASGAHHSGEVLAESVVSLTWHRAALLAVGPWLFSRVGWP